MTAAAEPAPASPSSSWSAESIADLLDEFGVTHSWILLQIDLIAANRSLVTKVLIGRLATVQHTVEELQEVAAHLASLEPSRLYAGLEVLADRIHTTRAAAAAVAPRPPLHLHRGGRR